MKDDKVYLEHIMDSLRKILDYTEELLLDTFLNDTKTQDACIHWKDMAGMRDKLIHDYIQVDPMIVWITISEEATLLLIAIEQAYNVLLNGSSETTI